MSEKSQPILYSKSLYKMGQDFSDIQYRGEVTDRKENSSINKYQAKRMTDSKIQNKNSLM